MAKKCSRYSTVVVTDVATVHLVPWKCEETFKKPIWGEHAKWQKNKSLTITPGKYDAYEIRWRDTTCWRVQPVGTDVDVVGKPEIEKLKTFDVDADFILMTGDEILGCEDSEKMSICSFSTGCDGAFRAVKFGDEFSFYTRDGWSSPKTQKAVADALIEAYKGIELLLSLDADGLSARLNEIAPGGKPSKEFWDLWNLDKDALRTIGISVSKDGDGFMVDFSPPIEIKSPSAKM